MSNITVRRPGSVPAYTQEWEPMRLMRDLFGWDPFKEMPATWKQERLVTFNPSFEVKENKESFVFSADVPGVKENDLEITLTGNRLTITGKREAEKEEKTDTYYAVERSYGSFTRAFTLPDGIDAEHLHAELKEGVLTLVVPKRTEAQTRKINVKAAAPKM